MACAVNDQRQMVILLTIALVWFLIILGCHVEILSSFSEENFFVLMHWSIGQNLRCIPSFHERELGNRRSHESSRNVTVWLNIALFSSMEFDHPGERSPKLTLKMTSVQDVETSVTTQQFFSGLLSPGRSICIEGGDSWVQIGTHHLDRATSPHSWLGVFRDWVVFRSNFPWMRLPWKRYVQ